VQLRKDSKGHELAIQREDVPADADWRLSVETEDASCHMVERRLGGTLRHNRALGLAIAAGRLISATRKNDPKVQEEAKLLGMELSHLGATPEQKREVFSNFFAPYTVKVQLADAKAFLESVEPVPVSRRKALRESLGSESTARVDALLALIRTQKAS
jgi:hypothetical protein